MTLRARVTAAVAAVVLPAVVAVGLLSRQIATVEFSRIVQREEITTQRSLPNRLPSWFSATAGDIGALADSIGPGWSVIALDSSGSVIATSDPTLDVRAEVTGGGVSLSTTSETGDATVRNRLRLTGPLPTTADGALVVFLPPRSEPELERQFHEPVSRWILIVVAVVGLLAIIGTWMLTGRFLKPVTGLTAAAQRLAAGDLESRAPFRGRDEISRLAQAFNRMAESLQASREQQRALVRQAAHELRTPVTSLRAQLEALRDGLLEPSSELIGSLSEELAHLSRLIADLQDVALGDAGEIQLSVERLCLADEVDRAVALLAAVEPKPTATVSINPEIHVRADSDRLRQILRNLLANASRHASAGAIAIEARVADQWVAVTVSDTGAGIDPEHLPHIFESFYRTDPSRARETGGSGLGLTIVRQLVEAHGGAISAASAPGEGTTFTFTLPRD